jgi:hypothetical protein
MKAFQISTGILTSAVCALTQSAPSPVFDVASIRISAAQGPQFSMSRLRISGNRVVDQSVTVIDLIADAM